MSNGEGACPRQESISSSHAPAVMAVGALLLMLLGASALTAQPFDSWITFVGHPTHGFVQIPHSAALNPTGAFTFEAWVFSALADGAIEDCRSLAGKNWKQTWWLGICNVGGVRTLRSYLKGSTSPRNGGRIPVGQWTHIAVVFDGATRKHYVNGELIMSVPETGPLPTNTAAMRIGSDVEWQFTPDASLNELRLWNAARTQEQIRANLNDAIGAQPGLVAIWRSGVSDVIGPHDGAIMGAGVGILTFPVALDCGTTTATAHCLRDRFLVSSKFRIGAPGTAEGTSQTINCPNPESGLFRFLGPNNWEIMLKVLNGCGLNNRYWVFSAATTNLFYRIEVFDVLAGAQKIYFNYPGPPAPAVTDTDAFATCP